MEDDVRLQPAGELLERLVADVELVQFGRRREIRARAGRPARGGRRRDVTR
jgi:hypothetical protein